jgi:hypothetical protein
VNLNFVAIQRHRVVAIQRLMEAVVATSLIDFNGCDGGNDGFNDGDDGIRRKRLSIKIALDRIEKM